MNSISSESCEIKEDSVEVSSFLEEVVSSHATRTKTQIIGAGIALNETILNRIGITQLKPIPKHITKRYLENSRFSLI